VALAATVGWLASREGMPPVAALVVFAALMSFSSHRHVRLPNGVFVSAVPMVTMASVVVFGHEHSLLGALVVGSAGALYLPSFNRGSWGWIPFNAAGFGFAGLAAVAVNSSVPFFQSSGVPAGLLGVCLSAMAYVAVSWTVLILSYVLEEGRSPLSVLAELAPTGPQVFPFAVLGYFLGRMYLSLGASVMLLIIVPILIAREMFGSYLRVKESHDETVQLLIRALEQKDPYTAGHAERVAVYAEYVGEELEFMPARMERLRFAALMHDIGKLVVPNQLLNKAGKLTEEEFARVRIHEGVSVQMLSHIDFLRPIAMHTHSDNMRFDPDDLSHPIEPYIIMVADAYDAMTSTRSYRKALPQEVAFQELRDKSGTQFHPACAEALIRAIEKRNEVHGKGHEEESHFEDAPEVGLGSAGLGDLLSDDTANEKANQ
jgi:HD superfamily phosphohydrolase YqeK